MSNYANLKSDIQAVIRENGNHEITGNLLQQSLLAIINSFGSGYIFKGVATPSTSPGTPDQNVFYIANQIGTYSNFGGIVIASTDGVCVLSYNGSWSKQSTGAITRTNLSDIINDITSLQVDEGYSLPWDMLPKFPYCITTSGNFDAISTDVHKVIPVKGGQVVTIKKGNDNAYWAIVKSYSIPSAGSTPDYAAGESARYISGTAEIQVTMPSDAKYIIVPQILNNTNRQPSVLKIDNYDVFKGIYQDLYEKAVEQITTNRLANGAVTTEKIENASVVKTKVGGLIADVLQNSSLLAGFHITGEATGDYRYVSALKFYPIPAGTKIINHGVRMILGVDSQLTQRKDISNGETWTATFDVNHIQESNVRGTYDLEVVGVAMDINTEKIADEAVTTPKLAGGAVTPEKASFFVDSKNLFDYQSMLIEGKYINSAGNAASNALWNCSDFIPISPDESDVVSNKFPNVGSGGSNCFYDANKQYITGSNFQSSTSAIPQNAAYVRFSFQNPTVAPLPNAIQVEYGTTPTAYVPYGKKINSKYIPDAAPNEIIVPKYLYLLSNVNNDVFYEPIVKHWNPYRYDIFADTTPGGRNYVKAIKRVVTLNTPTASGLSLKLYDAEKGDFIQTANMTFRKGVQGVGASQVKIGIIGDSYTDGGCFTPALLDNGYVPNLKMVGTRSVNTTNYVNQRLDGRSGWTLGTFSTPQTGADYFNPFVHPQGNHRFWGNTAFWANVCGGSPSGYGLRYTHYSNICDASGWPVSPVEGDVIYDTANSSWKEYQSGSWVNVQSSAYTWVFDYAKYRAMWGIELADIFCVMLGINDFWVNTYPSEENLSVWKTRLNAIITSYFNSNPSGKFVVLTTNTVTHPNVLHYRPLDVHERMQKLRSFVIKNWDNRESERIYLVDTAQLIDSENAFTLVEALPFDGYPNGYGYNNREIYAGDGQHPRVGYTTLGYSLAAFIQYIR